MFYLTIVNKILRHCHSWLARQYLECFSPQNSSPIFVNNEDSDQMASDKASRSGSTH